MAGREVFEPPLTGPEPVVLPLDDLPKVPLRVTKTSLPVKNSIAAHVRHRRHLRPCPGTMATLVFELICKPWGMEHETMGRRRRAVRQTRRAALADGAARQARPAAHLDPARRGAVVRRKA